MSPEMLFEIQLPIRADPQCPRRPIDLFGTLLLLAVRTLPVAIPLLRAESRRDPLGIDLRGGRPRGGSARRDDDESARAV